MIFFLGSGVAFLFAAISPIVFACYVQMELNAYI